MAIAATRVGLSELVQAGRDLLLVDVDTAIVKTAKENPTDGYRMICALTRRKTGRTINRKRVLRVMREQKLIQSKRRHQRRKRPGFFQVERPGRLWHMDMTSIWVAEHGWCYLNAIIDCRSREIVGWSLDLRCRAQEARSLIEAAAAAQRRAGSADARHRQRHRLHVTALPGEACRTRDHPPPRRLPRPPKSQAFIESWFGKLKEREVWRNEYETLADARAAIGGYVER